MKQPLAATRSLIDRQALIDIALTNPEQFRDVAEKNMQRFLPRERALVAPLTKYGFDPTTLFDAWNDTLREQRRSLIVSRDSAAFQRSIAKHLLLSTSQAGATVDHLMKQRDADLVESFIEHLFPPENRHSRYHQTVAKHILSMSDSSMAALVTHYTDVALTISVSDEYGITSVDPHASLFRRMKAKRAVKREQRALYASESRQLRAITRQQKELSRQFGGLVGTLFDLPIEFIVINAARQDFHKAIMKRPDQDTVALAKTVSAEPIAQLLRTMSKNISDDGRHTSVVQLENLVWTVIQRSTVEVNQMMAMLKQLRELRAEQLAIENNRTNRRAIVKR